MSEAAVDETSVDLNQNKPDIREDLVNTAVKFLENPNVIKTSLAEQQRFLRRKGLTDEEIRAACERSGAYAFQRTRAPTLPAAPTYSSQLVHYTLFDKIKEIVHNVAIFSFVAYSIYQFYQKFIAPFLFGKRKKTIEDSIGDLEKNLQESVKDLQSNLNSVKLDVNKLSQGAESSTQRQLSDLKSEIATVKGLLLSRNQFPSVVSAKGPVLRSSIPAWQKTSLTSQTNDSDDSDPDPAKSEDLLDIGSGSGSSEHEHNTKNSDSSFDVISCSSKESDFVRHNRNNDEEDY